MHQTWTIIEKSFIRDNADKMTDKILTEHLNKLSNRKITQDAVRKVRNRMGLKKMAGRGICELRKNV